MSTQMAILGSSEACLQCRRVKMKCRRAAESRICERCMRRSTECVFFQKKRGRKPTLKPQIPRPSDSRHEEDRGSVPRSKDITSPKRFAGVSESELLVTPNEPVTLPNQSLWRERSSFWDGTETMQPSGLLSRSATEGQYSLQNVLNVNHNTDTDKLCNAYIPDDDPIHKGLVSYHIATSLFEGFIKSFNPFICLLDPALHTFQYIRERSSFLLTVMISASAKAYNPVLHLELHNHAEKLFIDCFARGKKSPEIIQAILLRTYWKQPDDTRSWSHIGYAIRLCMELGWHKLTTPRKETSLDTELVIRQKRNIERTWMVLFVYDRSMSIQTGKPWMIERSELIETTDQWYQNPFATPNDALLAAFVSLRLTSADILEAFNPQKPASFMAHPSRFDTLLKSHTPRIDAWKKHWLRIVSQKETCHSFLVSFFGAHLVLLLYSFRLQASTPPSANTLLPESESLWVTYNSALEMLQLVSDPSLSPLLGFAHDSVHVMTAYAAAFLVKLLLRVDQNIRNRCGGKALRAIETASQVFAYQNAPPTFACSLQAAFLKNIMRGYREIVKARLPDHSLMRNPNKALNGVDPQESLPTGDRTFDVASSVPSAKVRSSQPSVSHEPEQPPQIIDARQQRPPSRNDLELVQAERFNDAASGFESTSSNYSNLADFMPYEWNSGGDDCWTTMFMDAGFGFEDDNTAAYRFEERLQ